MRAGVVTLMGLAACSFSGPSAVTDDAAVADSAAETPDATDLVTAVVIEAEDRDDQIDRNATTWIESSARPGASSTYMRTDGASTCDPGDCAELIFDLYLDGPATYYVHARAFAANGGSDSFHWWLDDGASSVQDYQELTGQWQFETFSLGPVEPGHHVLHISKRDGIELDLLVVDQSADAPGS